MIDHPIQTGLAAQGDAGYLGEYPYDCCDSDPDRREDGPGSQCRCICPEAWAIHGYSGRRLGNSVKQSQFRRFWPGNGGAPGEQSQCARYDDAKQSQFAPFWPKNEGGGGKQSQFCRVRLCQTNPIYGAPMNRRSKQPVYGAIRAVPNKANLPRQAGGADLSCVWPDRPAIIRAPNTNGL